MSAIEKEQESSTVYLIDASIYIFKYYFSMPSHWHTATGRPTETVYGYTLWLLKFLNRTKAKKVAVCFDESLGLCFRNQIYPLYKTSRVHPDDDLAFQLLACKKVTALLGLGVYASDIYEADDLLGTWAKACRQHNTEHYIMSKDKDLSQLVLADNAYLWGELDEAPLGAEGIRDKVGVLPTQVADYLALVGDPVDDIPGVPGVGKKTAISLLSHYHSWEGIRSRLDDIHSMSIRGAKSLQAKLIEYRDQVDTIMKVTTIEHQAFVPNWSDLKRAQVELDELKQFADALGFPPSLLKKIQV